MKMINLIQCEFIKNETVKKWLIIVFVLLLSVIGIVELRAFSISRQIYDIKKEIGKYRNYSNVQEGTYQTAQLKEFDKFSYQNKLNLLKEFENETIYHYDWRYQLLFEIEKLEEEIFVLNQIIKDPENEFFKEIGTSEAYQFGHYDGMVRKFYGLSNKELNDIILKNEKIVSDYKNLIHENIYYHYLEYGIKNIEHFDVDGELQILVNHKIKDEQHFLSLNQKQLHYSIGFDGYYGRPFDTLEQEASLILKYSLQNQKKHDFSFPEKSLDNVVLYETSKTAVDQIVILSVIVLLLMVLTSGGIITKEHELKTEKLLLISPNKRWKILLSKFIYLILKMYVIWLIALILLILYAGIRYGFGDLFTSKLIVVGENVKEVNYFLYLFKEMLICSIPMIAFLSMLFMISTVTFSTTATVGMSIIILFVSPFLWYLITTFRLGFLVYTPFPYIHFGLILRNHSYYLMANTVAVTSVSYGIFISIVMLIVCYGIAHFIYTKRDIKN